MNTIIGSNHTQEVSSVVKLKTLDIEPGNQVRTLSYDDAYETSITPAIGGSLYEITTLALYRIKISNGAWVPDGTKDFYLDNGNVAVDLLAESPSSVATLKTLDLPSGEIISTLSYYEPSSTVEAKGGATYQIFTLAEWQTLTGETTPDAHGDHVLTNGNVASLLIEGTLLVETFGAPTGSSDVDKLTAAVARAKRDSLDIRFNAGDTYSLPKGSETISEYGVRVHSDPVYDKQGLYGVMLDGFENTTIDASGAVFTTDSGCPFVLYRCKEVTWVGGDFSRTGSDADITTDEASALLITRSGGCVGKRMYVTGYYRNLESYRSVASGFSDNCISINARYYCYYCASTIDITLTGYTDENITEKQFARNCTAKGGRFGNYFADNSNIEYNHSFDCNPDGNSAAHIKTEFGGSKYVGNVVVETSDQNSGDRIDGISAVYAQIVAADIVVDVIDNDVTGCYKAYTIAGLRDSKVTGNKARNYYQTGMSILTQVVGGSTYNIERCSFTNNTILHMNDSSTRVSVGNDKNAGFQIERNDSIDFDDVYVADNFVDALGDNATKTPSFNTYVEATEDSVKFGRNGFTDTAPNTLPWWIFRAKRTLRQASFVSSGSTAAPTAIDETYCYDGVISLFNSNVMLPDAEAGMRITFAASSSTCRIYLDGANSGATSSNTVYLGGGSPSSTNRNIQLSGPGMVTLVCSSSNVWFMDTTSAILVT